MIGNLITMEEIVDRIDPQDLKHDDLLGIKIMRESVIPRLVDEVS